MQENQRLISTFVFGDMKITYLLNNHGGALFLITPKDKECDFENPKNCSAYNVASLVQLLLSEDSSGMFSCCYKQSETLAKLKYHTQKTVEDQEKITVITTLASDDGYGINHHLTWYRGEKGVEIFTEFFNNSNRSLTLEYLTSASLEALSPYLDNEGSESLVFHRFKAGWSMEGLHQADSFIRLGLERAWGGSGECIKLGTLGSRAVREYHPYAAVEDTKNGVTFGVYLAHNASWQMELSRAYNNVSLSIGLADRAFGEWSKKIPVGESFCSPVAYASATTGGIAELSNRILSMHHRKIDKLNEGDSMGIVYNDFITTWGKPTHKGLVDMAKLLSRGKTKYIVMDAGWYAPYRAIGQWDVDTQAFPKGMKQYCDEIRAMGFVPGIWMEFEGIDSNSAELYNKPDGLKLTKDGHDIVGHVINGRCEKFWDFRKKEAIEYLDKKVIKFLRDCGFGYLKVDYNASIGAAMDGDDSPGENLRHHMELVKDYFIKIKEGVPGIVIENCASGGCRLEPSMMNITEMSSASDTHEVYEAAVVAANLHYLTPPRQNQIWATLHPNYSPERFSFVISQAFLGRLCWSGKLGELSREQLDEMFAAESFYEKVCHIIRRGNSYIYRTDICSFHNPKGTQAVVRYSEDNSEALVVVHSFDEPKQTEIELLGSYEISQMLYKDDTRLSDSKLLISKKAAFSGNVYYLKKIN